MEEEKKIVKGERGRERLTTIFISSGSSKLEAPHRSLVLAWSSLEQRRKGKMNGGFGWWFEVCLVLLVGWLFRRKEIEGMGVKLCGDLVAAMVFSGGGWWRPEY
ncbi:hypothetical protein KY289_016708 [Solanum tuberosum]|nr:hypothetical protein KY289_016708 [Solanum tuberosum]